MHIQINSLILQNHIRNQAQMTHSATDCNFFQIPYNRRKTLADHGFSSAGPRLWNSLPLEL